MGSEEERGEVLSRARDFFDEEFINSFAKEVSSASEMFAATEGSAADVMTEAQAKEMLMTCIGLVVDETPYSEVEARLDIKLRELGFKGTTLT